MTESEHEYITQHLKRWQTQIDASSFWLKEISSRILEQLSYIKIAPKIILDVSHPFYPQGEALQKLYPSSDIQVSQKALNKQNHISQKKTQNTEITSRKWNKSFSSFSRYLFNFLNIKAGLKARAPKKNSYAHLLSDYHALPFANQSIDLIVSNCLLFSINDLPSIFREWQRVLAPNGLILFSTLGPDTLQEIQPKLKVTQNSILEKQAKSMSSSEKNNEKNEFSSPQVCNLKNGGYFIDMHDLGDTLLQQGFSEPVMSMEKLTLYYKNSKLLLHDLKVNHFYPSENCQPFINEQFLDTCYSASAHDLPLTCEIIFGHAWKNSSPNQNKNQPFMINTAQIVRRQYDKAPK